MAESRSSNPEKTPHKGLTQIYVRDEMVEAVLDLTANNNPKAMLTYIKKNCHLDYTDIQSRR